MARGVCFSRTKRRIIRRPSLVLSLPPPRVALACADPLSVVSSRKVPTAQRSFLAKASLITYLAVCLDSVLVVGLFAQPQEGGSDVLFYALTQKMVFSRSVGKIYSCFRCAEEMTQRSDAEKYPTLMHIFCAVVRLKAARRPIRINHKEIPPSGRGLVLSDPRGEGKAGWDRRCLIMPPRTPPPAPTSGGPSTPRRPGGLPAAACPPGPPIARPAAMDR